MARPTHNGNHALQSRPAIQADIAYSGPKVADGAREQRVPDDGLNGYDEAAAETLVSRGRAETLAERESQSDGVVGRERGKAIRGLLI